MPFDDPAHGPMLTRALTQALEDCGADRWAEAPAFLVSRYLVSCYEAFVLGANDRHRWQHCRERDPHWPPPPCPPEPQG